MLWEGNWFSVYVSTMPASTEKFEGPIIRYIRTYILSHYYDLDAGGTTLVCYQAPSWCILLFTTMRPRHVQWLPLRPYVPPVYLVCG